MQAPRGKYVIGDFTEREVRMIQLRTQGIKTSDAAKIMGLKRHEGYNLMWKIFCKAGVDDVALLTRWAIENGIDEALPPETPEEQAVPVPKARPKRVKLNRVPSAFRGVRHMKPSEGRAR